MEIMEHRSDLLIMSLIMTYSIDNVNNVANISTSSDVLEAVHTVMTLVRTRHQRALREAGHSITPMEGRVLGFFVRHPGATLTDLAEHAGRDKGQLTRLVQGLRERGLLTAQPDPADRRVTRLAPSVEAQDLHTAVLRQRHRLAETAAAGLTEAERATLVALLARLSHNLQARDANEATEAVDA